MGPTAGMLIALGGLISILGSNAGTMLAGPRVTYAMAERGQLPPMFGRVHSRFRTPHVSIVLYAAVALALAASGSFEQMAKVSAVGPTRLLCGGPARRYLCFRRSPGAASKDVFRLPGGMTIPALAIAGSLAIVFGADTVSLASGAVALVIGGLLYAAYGRHSTVLVAHRSRELGPDPEAPGHQASSNAARLSASAAGRARGLAIHVGTAAAR